MHEAHLTLAIYGIQDISDSTSPEHVHDHSLAVYKSGKIIKFIQLERLSRCKYDKSMPDRIYNILKELDLIKNRQVDFIFVDNVIGRSFINKQGNIRFEVDMARGLSAGHEYGYLYFMGEKKVAYMLNHEMAHLYSCLPFHGHFKPNSLLVHFDGGASQSNFSAWYWDGKNMRNILYDWELGEVTNLFNANALAFSMLGMKKWEQNALAGKLMGYAAHGHYREEIEHWLKENDFFANSWGKPSFFLNKANERWGAGLRSFDLNNFFLKDIAATFQHVFQRESLKKIGALVKNVPAKTLYFTGGCALNIPLNKALLDTGWFQDIFIPPCPGDSGLAIGAGAYLETLKGQAVKVHSPFLNTMGIEENSGGIDNTVVARAASLLEKGKVLGICNGPGEAGPRALGNRSIICRADDKGLFKKVSQEMKKREWYRPLAPVMLEKNARLATGLQNIPCIGRFMLLQFDVLEEFHKPLAGAVHVDGTARVQVIRERDDNPFLFELLTYMDKKYNRPALINTSFNQKGQPMVHNKQDAIEAAREMNLDALVLNGKLVEFQE